MGISRFSVIMSPFDSKYLEQKFLITQIAVVIVLSFTLSIAAMIAYFILSQPILPTGLCLLLGNLNRSPIPKATTMITFLTQAGYVLSISIIYGWSSFTHCWNKWRYSEVTVCLFDKSDLLDPIFYRSWYDSDMGTVSIQLLILTTAVILPLNSIINPFVFVFSSKISALCRARKFL